VLTLKFLNCKDPFFDTKKLLPQIDNGRNQDCTHTCRTAPSPLYNRRAGPLGARVLVGHDRGLHRVYACVYVLMYVYIHIYIYIYIHTLIDVAFITP